MNSTRSPVWPTTLTHLECSHCAAVYASDRQHKLCESCARPLLARYDLARARQTLTLSEARRRAPGFAAYAEVMPFAEPPIDLGEARTPLIRAEALDPLVAAKITIKDESLNPTGSFKARGLAAAVSRALELGARGVALPTAGNAGLALAAYAAQASLPALVVCPRDTPSPFVKGMRQLGAEVILHDGLIDACGPIVAERAAQNGYFDLSTLKEPYRVEGKKTMGYDLVRDAERLPDVIVYPTGGGTGIVGLWKAFDEMQALGWIDRQRPRLVSVQAAGCAPLVRAFETGAAEATPWEHGRTYASGLRVPRAVGDRLILGALRASNGIAVAVTDEAMAAAAAELSSRSGVLAAPEGGACWAALRELARRGWLRTGETVVLFNTGTALSYS